MNSAQWSPGAKQRALPAAEASCAMAPALLCLPCEAVSLLQGLSAGAQLLGAVWSCSDPTHPTYCPSLPSPCCSPPGAPALPSCSSAPSSSSSLSEITITKSLGGEKLPEKQALVKSVFFPFELLLKSSLGSFKAELLGLSWGGDKGDDLAQRGTEPWAPPALGLALL